MNASWWIFTSSASKLTKLAIAKPSMMSSSQDTDSLFLRRGGLCLPKPGRRRQSLPPVPAGPSTLSVPRASRSEPEDRDVARCSAGSTRLLRRRSLSRCDRDRRLCRNPALRLGTSMCQTESPFLCATPVRPKGTFLIFKSPPPPPPTPHK